VFLTSLFGEPTCFRHSWQYPFSWRFKKRFGACISSTLADEADWWAFLFYMVASSSKIWCWYFRTTEYDIFFPAKVIYMHLPSTWYPKIGHLCLFWHACHTWCLTMYTHVQQLFTAWFLRLAWSSDHLASRGGRKQGCTIQMTRTWDWGKGKHETRLERPQVLCRHHIHHPATYMCVCVRARVCVCVFLMTSCLMNYES